MKKRIYIGAGASALIAIAALVCVSLARGATKATREDIPDPPLMARFSVSGKPARLGGLERLRLLLLARSKTDSPMPNVKIYIKFETYGDVRFLPTAARDLGRHESFHHSSSDPSKWVWKMDGVPADTKAPARLGLQIYFLPLKRGQRFSFSVWGTTSVGSKPTPRQHYRVGVA